MRIVKHRLKNQEGEITVVPESLDDLWHLKYVLEKGDLIYADTMRRSEVPADKLRPEKAEKRPVRLGLRLENIEFHKFTNRLRLQGIIEQGVDIGSYHTINIEPNSELSIVKKWEKDQIERLNEAVRTSNQPKVAIITIEEGEAVFGLVKQYGVEEFTYVKGSRGKREGGDPRGEFFGEVLEKLDLLAAAEVFVIAGPGFTKKDFIAYVKERKPELASKFVVEDTSSIGTSGFQEVFRRGAIDRILRHSRITQEAILFEKLLQEIAREGKGKAAYGMAEVIKASEYGAIETLLIVDETLREARGSEEKKVEELLRSVEKAQGRIVIFSSEFEPGKRLQALGGIAALLRFRVD
ncbi:MAG: mRNA surveillance protein pelota [Methanocellales archaeon]